MLKAGIYGQFYHKNAAVHIQQLFDILIQHKVEIVVEKAFYKGFSQNKTLNQPTYHFNTFEQLDPSYDVFFSIGGDGTILKAITYIKDLNIPLAGINTGRLGFLASIQRDDIANAVLCVLKKNYKLSKRSLLSIETNPQNKDLNTLNFALNEVSVIRKNTTSMIKIDTHLNDEYLTSYWSDGLIIATPTGSTGYSLSCGGPVVEPSAKSLIITPIAPHNLNARPIVVPDNTEIKLTVSGREKSFWVSLDSRNLSLDNQTQITIKKSPFYINMIQLEEDSFIKTLRKKLLWGEDKRN